MVVELVVVLVARGHVAERVAQLVDERDVLDRQQRPGTPPPVTHDLDSSRCSSSVSTPSETRASSSGSRSQPKTSVAVSGGHQATAKSMKSWRPSISSSNASRPRSRPRSPRTWRHIASSRVVATRGSCRLRWPCDISWRRSRPSTPRSRWMTSSRQNTRNSAALPGACWRAVRRITSAIRSDALEVGDRRLVVAGRPHAVDDLAERAQRDGGLAERGQHPLDVAHEDPAGADDQHAAALVAAAVGVEQERRAVQRDDRLAGAGAAGDRDDALAGRADRLVLLGLDRGHDGVHRPVAGPRELRHQGALADDRQVGLDAVVEQLVLDAEHPCAAAAQHPAAYDVVRGGGGGLVEHRGSRCPPVDQQRLALGVAQPDPADVARLGVALGAQVEPAEDQSLVGGVELGDAACGLEDHGVALDEAALVLEPAAAVALARQRLRRLGGVAQLDVDAVDEGLLVRDLALGEVITHCGSPDFVGPVSPLA